MHGRISFFKSQHLTQCVVGDYQPAKNAHETWRLLSIHSDETLARVAQNA